LPLDDQLDLNYDYDIERWRVLPLGKACLFLYSRARYAKPVAGIERWDFLWRDMRGNRGDCRFHYLLRSGTLYSSHVPQMYKRFDCSNLTVKGKNGFKYAYAVML
jgi:hypothetical protein